MLEQIQGIPRGLICLCLSGSLRMTFVMGGISRGDSRQFVLLKIKKKTAKYMLQSRLTLPGATTGDPTHDKGHVEET